ncbi:MAG: pantothenate kinase, partial [Paracoccaceae bacterium]
AMLFAETENLFDALEPDLTMHGLTVINAFNKDA